jgi:hypothetical protein
LFRKILETFNVKSYTLIDLNQVLKLTKKFLEKTNTDLSKIKFKTSEELDNEQYDQYLFVNNLVICGSLGQIIAYSISIKLAEFPIEDTNVYYNYDLYASTFPTASSSFDNTFSTASLPTSYLAYIYFVPNLNSSLSSSSDVFQIFNSFKFLLRKNI